jgi:hypothetical protein
MENLETTPDLPVEFPVKEGYESKKEVEATKPKAFKIVEIHVTRRTERVAGQLQLLHLDCSCFHHPSHFTSQSLMTCSNHHDGAYNAMQCAQVSQRAQ